MGYIKSRIWGLGSSSRLKPWQYRAMLRGILAKGLGFRIHGLGFQVWGVDEG